jgi:methylated-DNA-[protein]-cysteine S-methyltransferase
MLLSAPMPDSQPGMYQAEGSQEPLRILVPSPLGPLGIELVHTAVVRLLIDPITPIAAAFTPLHKVPGSDVLDEILGRLSEYFAGARRKLDIEFDLGPSGVTGFARRVLREAAKIGYGRTRTHHALAGLAGRPDAAVEVLSILLANPIPILIPCHRVISDTTALDGYIGGMERRNMLLRIESQATEAV